MSSANKQNTKLRLEFMIDDLDILIDNLDISMANGSFVYTEEIKQIEMCIDRLLAKYQEENSVLDLE
jgi:hypothetical protein